MKSTLIIGIGNRHRGDDALGCIIAEELRGLVPVIEHDGEPASLIDSWQGYQRVILVDAVSSGAKPGTVFYFDLNKQALPDIFNQTSTHAFGVAEAVELARVLEKLPPQIIFYGIEAINFSTEETLSPEVRAAGDEIRNRIIEDLKEEKMHA